LATSPAAKPAILPLTPAASLAFLQFTLLSAGQPCWCNRVHLVATSGQ
jgi:hypothetical protein